MPFLDMTVFLIGQAAAQESYRRSVDLLPWFAWVAIVAIIAGCLSNVITSWIKHRERMAMIQMGLHPDLPPDSHPTTKPIAPEAVEL